MIAVVIPLRLESVRVPRKILADIAGECLAVRTVQRVIDTFKNESDIKVIAAVDSSETKKILEAKFSTLKVVLTDPELASGTDRIFAAVNACIDADPQMKSSLIGIMNVQGDMPFIGSAGMQQICAYFREKARHAQDPNYLLTLSQTWPTDQKYSEPAAVKVISDQHRRALYFSRFPIPYSRMSFENINEPVGELHIGVYGFTLESLSRFCAHSAVALEKAESLEQLRALWLGIPIYVLQTEAEARTSYRGIDTREDIEWAQAFAKEL